LPDKQASLSHNSKHKNVTPDSDPFYNIKGMENSPGLAKGSQTLVMQIELLAPADT